MYQYQIHEYLRCEGCGSKVAFSAGMPIHVDDDGHRELKDHLCEPAVAVTNDNDTTTSGVGWPE